MLSPTGASVPIRKLCAICNSATICNSKVLLQTAHRTADYCTVEYMNIDIRVNNSSLYCTGRYRKYYYYKQRTEQETIS